MTTLGNLSESSTNSEFFRLPVRRDLDSAIIIEKVKGTSLSLGVYLFHLQYFIDLSDIVYVQEDSVTILIFLKDRKMANKITAKYDKINIHNHIVSVKKVVRACCVTNMVICIPVEVPDELIKSIFKRAKNCNLTYSDFSLSRSFASSPPRKLAHICFNFVEVTVTGISLRDGHELVRMFSQHCEVLNFRQEMATTSMFDFTFFEQSQSSIDNCRPDCLNLLFSVPLDSPYELFVEEFISKLQQNKPIEKITKTVYVKNERIKTDVSADVDSHRREKVHHKKHNTSDIVSTCEISKVIRACTCSKVNKCFGKKVIVNYKNFEFEHFANGIMHALLDTTGHVSTETKCKYIKLFDDYVRELPRGSGITIPKSGTVKTKSAKNTIS